MADLVKGFFLKTPHENAPDWVKRKVSVNVQQFMTYLHEHENEKGYVNFDLKEAQTGHWYLQLDEWKPEQRDESQPEPAQSTGFSAYKPSEPKQETFFEDDIPF